MLFRSSYLHLTSERAGEFRFQRGPERVGIDEQWKCNDDNDENSGNDSRNLELTTHKQTPKRRIADIDAAKRESDVEKVCVGEIAL